MPFQESEMKTPNSCWDIEGVIEIQIGLAYNVHANSIQISVTFLNWNNSTTIFSIEIRIILLESLKWAEFNEYIIIMIE